jgi:sugar transferase (PEP-CTERM/EpsH1 system associated)
VTAPVFPDVLYLVHRVPYPPDNGDRIRAFNILRFLAARARVHLACLADEPVEEAVPALRPYCERLGIVRLRPTRWARSLVSLACGRSATEGAFASPALRALLRGWARGTRFHACLASASSMLSYLRLREWAGVPAVIDLVDVDSQKWFDYAAAGRGPRSWLYRLEGHRLRRLERGLPAWARAVTLVSEAEAQLYRGFCLPGDVRAVPNGVDLDYFRPGAAAAEPSCVFVGALDYRPNVDGAVWFCSEVWPEIVRRQPQARLYLVGRRPAPAVLRLAGAPGVEVVGQVPDVRPYLARAAVTVVPLRIARGIQNKVLEALAMGRAVVASPQALEGLAVQPGVHVWQASTPAEWVRAIRALWADTDRQLALARAGRRHIEENHRWVSCLEPFATLLGVGTSAPAEPSALAPDAGTVLPAATT